MPTFFNFNNRKGVFMIPAGATKSPTPAPPSFSNTKSLLFDGVDEYVDLGNPTYLQSSTTATISLWVKFTDVTTAGYTNLLTVGNSGTRLLFMRINPYNTVRRIEFGVLSSFARATSADFSDLSSGVWYHIMGFYNRDLNDGTDCEIWLNGSKIHDVDVTATLPATITENMYIADQGIFSPLDGNLDEVAVWNTDERANASAIYNGGVPGNLNDLPTPPNQWYRCGDNSTYQTPQILMPEDTNKDKVSNYSLTFDGVDDYVDIGNPTELQITGNLTLSAWVKRDSTSTSNNYMIIGKDNVTTGIRAYSLVRNSSTGKAQLNIWKSNVLYNVQSTTTINNDQWYHIMGVNDGSDLKIYVNGVLENTNVGGGGTIDNATIDFEIGRRQAFTNEGYWNGSIDEVAVWNSDQSANISTIYNSGTPTTITGATAYWKLGEQATFSTNWTVPDQVGSNDGTSANMTIEDRVGDAPNSSNNAVSFNMEEADIDNDTP